MTEPFDRGLPSPIAAVLDLRAQAPGAVVPVEGLTPLQTDAYVPADADERLLDLVRAQQPPHLIIATGSAGTGKSALMAKVAGEHRPLFGDILEDATHSDSPSASQVETLKRFFEPFRDGAGAPPPGPPRAIAMNVGMALEFFRLLKASGSYEYTLLERVLKWRLGISADEPESPPWRLALLNLDLRATAGAGGLFQEMLGRLDFDRADGVLGGAPRCSTCQVRAWCPVRANAKLASTDAGDALDTVAAAASTERGRHDAPRQLWDWAARVITGGDDFDTYADPCDAVAAAAERDDAEWVFEHLLVRSVFAAGGELGERARLLDPSLQPSADAHKLMAAAGITPDDDAAALSQLDPEPPGAFATAARHLVAGKNGASQQVVARALIAAAFLREPDRWRLHDELAEEFDDLLGQYRAYSVAPGPGYPAVEALRPLFQRALGRGLGVLHNEVPYVPVEAYDPRNPSHVFVDAQLDYQPGIYDVPADPAVVRDRDGAELAGHRPLAVTVLLGGVEVAVTLPVFRLLCAAAAGTAASTADLERFYALRRAVESLARNASGAQRALLVERPGTGRRYAVNRTPGLGGQELVTVRELVG